MRPAPAAPVPMAREEGEAEAAPQPQPSKPARLVHYHGFVKLKVTSPAEALEQAQALATAAGGYVEQSSDTVVVLRIPVDKLRQVFADVQKIGDVLSRSLTAQDVTDAYTALELRLSTLSASRDRLVELLAKVRNEQEKLSLLREIRRLTEEIDQLEIQTKTLLKLAAYSRLSVEVVPRQAHTAEAVEELAAFRFILDLSPFRRDVARGADRLDFTAPDGFVELDKKGPWIAESADGAVIWTSERDNEPRGDTDYWLEAVRTRLAPGWAEQEVLTVGDYKVLRLVDAGSAHYRYLVGVKAAGKHLDLVEVYYPSPEHEKRHDAAVRAAIGKGES